ncbi:MAG: hypothetical protein KDJ14_04315 [Xanthomonadales bacterium]|nr:hypothetical protein [Xanthomonadales bacterium]
MSVARAITQTAYWLRRLSLLSLAAFAGVAAAEVPANPGAEPLLELLLRGERAGALVATLQDGETKRAVERATPSVSGALDRAASVARALRDELDAPQPDQARVQSLLGQLQAVDLLVQNEFDSLASGSKFRGASIPPERIELARQRWQRSLDAMRSELSLALAAEASARSAALRATAKRLDALIERTPQPVFGGGLPLQRPRLVPRLPLGEPFIAPSYASGGVEVDPLPEDLLDADEATATPAIRAKAQSLGYDHVAIFDFVRSQVRMQWYAGAQKSADETLRTLAGNDIDQASLLIALLRASSAPARYVRGVVELPAAHLAEQIGVSELRVGAALAGAGVAHQPIVSQGQVAGYRVEHTWVTAFVPYGNYRGSHADTSERSWIPLMPALKAARFAPAQPVLDPAALSVPLWIESYLQQGTDTLPWSALRTELAVRLAQRNPPVELSDLLAVHRPDAEPLELLPASAPYEVTATVYESARLFGDDRQRLQLVLRNGAEASAAIALEAEWPISELANRRVGIGYTPATVEDQHLANAYGGLDQVPAYLIRVRPTVWIGGLPAQAGEGIAEPGSVQRLELRVVGPAGEVDAVQYLRAGALAGLAIDPQGDLPGVDPVADAPISEPRASRLLSGLARTYLAGWDAAAQDSAATLGVSVLRPLPALTLALAQYRFDEVFGLAQAMQFEGVALDALLHPIEPITHRGNSDDEADWLDAMALHGSALEAEVFASEWGVDATSADGLLRRAVQQSVPWIELSFGDDAAAPLAAHDVAVREHVQGWLDRGMDVTIPRDPLAIDAWTGSGWRVRNPATAETGWFLSGRYAGGATTILPSAWYIQDIAEAFRNPYGAEPNENPLAGVLVQLDASAQQQRGVAGELLPQSLIAYVTDEIGRPVKNAVVTFVVEQGTGQLEAEGSSGLTVTARTDARGVARAQFRSPEHMQGTGIWVQETDQTHPQWMAANAIGLSVATAGGPLYPERPYIAYTRPAAPAEVRLTQHNNHIRLVPGLGTREIRVAVVDAYDNEISNAEVALDASDDFSGLQCQAPGLGQAPPSVLFELGDVCPVDRPHDAGCGQPSLTVLTRFGGTRVHLAAAPVLSASITVHAETATGEGGSGSNETSVVFTTMQRGSGDQPGEPCEPVDWFGLVQWYYPHWGDEAVALAVNNGTGFFEITPESMEAAAPGTRFPLSRKVALAQGNDQGVINWSGLQAPAIESISLQGATAQLDGGVAGGAQYSMTAGDAPARVTGEIIVLPPGQPRWFVDVPTAAVLEVEPSIVLPERIQLTPLGLTSHPIALGASWNPSDYLSRSALVELLADDTARTSCTVALSRSPAGCEFPRSLSLPQGPTYTLRTTLNPGTPFELQSEPIPAPIQRGLIGGIVADDGETPLSELTILGSAPKKIEVDYVEDPINAYRCDSVTRFAFVVGQDAEVDLTILNLDSDRQVSGVAMPVVQGQQLSEGVHAASLSSADLAEGAYLYELRMRAADGAEDVLRGDLNVGRIGQGSLPLAHAFVKGVDLHDGGAVISVEDAAIDGRGPGLRFTRTYASHQGDQETLLGRGWSSSLDSHIEGDRCGQRTVTGSVGQGQRFRPVGANADGDFVFAPMHGYHGSLLRRASGGYDFYSKDGTRHHFDGLGTRLQFIEDPNGNRVDYTYSFVGNQYAVSRISDAAGRSLQFIYKDVVLSETTIAGAPFVDTKKLLAEVVGPLGLRICYGYDADANLASVQRLASGTCPSVDPNQSPPVLATDDRYAYENFGYGTVIPSQGDPRLIRLGWRLTEATNALSQDVRAYELQEHRVKLGGSGDFPDDYPQIRAVGITEPDGGETHFTYLGVRYAEAGSTIVRDARGFDTTYELNGYGAAEVVTDPAGTTRTTWDFTALQPASVTDALGTVTSYQYDEHGNKTSEQVVHAHGTLQRSWSYFAPSVFDVPIKHRVRTFTDARGIDTDYSWDARGNALGMTRGTITETYQVNDAGDRVLRTDGNEFDTHYSYDGFGYLASVTDELGTVQSATFDARGRQTSASDGAGARTDYNYDARDRLLRTRHPRTSTDPNAPRDETSMVYDDVQRRVTQIDELGRSTLNRFDPMGRTVEVRNAQGRSRAMSYDFNGNLLSESDFRGNPTTHTYDGANRRLSSLAPLGRLAEYAYDALGHVLSETMSGDGGTPRVSEYRYEDPNYQRTRVTRRNPGGDDSESVTAYDENGNPIQVTDPRGFVTTRSFDARDRLVTQSEPEGRTTTLTYDGADRKLSETLSGPGLAADQLRRWSYDGRGRERSRTDATGGVWRSSYDAASNVASRTDPRGGVVNLTYDARHRPLTENGPVPDRVMQYGYDAVGNRIDELHADGRHLQHDYDVLNRRVASRDLEGDFAPAEFERIGYDDDGHVRSRVDANGYLTSVDVDALGRTTAEHRPLGRNLVWTYTIHDEVLSETDAEQATTTHDYDALGRRTRSTAPFPFLYQTLFAYDPSGNLLRQMDARGATTHFVYDGLNRRTSQIDPPVDGPAYTQSWSYDAAGNAVTHTDRRGLVTESRYDGENRLVEQVREGLRRFTNTYDASGNLATERDANGNTTTHRYNAANERTQTERPDDVTESWTYFPWGDVASMTDADGITTSYAYDLRHRQISETMPHPDGTSIITHAYDGQGNRVETVRPQGAAYRWQFAYDQAHLLVGVVSPEGHATTYAYDLADRRTSIRDADARTTATSYDALGRITRIDYADGSFETVDAYDANGNLTERRDANGTRIDSSFDALNRLIRRTYSGPAQAEDIVEERWTYDGNANLVRIEQQAQSGSTYATTRSWDVQERLSQDNNRHGQQTTHTYDAQGNRTRRLDDEGATAQQFDRLHRLRAVQPAGEGAIALTYTDAGRIASQTYPNGATTEHQYDSAGRVATITHRQSGVVVQTLQYTYDRNGNRSEEFETGAEGSRRTQYQYDRDDRLTGSTLTAEDGSVTQTDYTLDAVGNRMSEVVTAAGTPVANKTFAYNARHQLDQVADSVTSEVTDYTYDDNGFTTSASTNGQLTSFRPNLQDRLATLTTPTGPPVDYAYDVDGLRVEKRTSSEAVRFGYDGSHLRRETNVTNNLLASYDWLGQRVLRARRSGSTAYAQHDALRSPIRWTRADGGEQARARFDAWGVLLNESGDLPAVRFTGYYADAESGDYYAQQRYYRQGVGRFNRIDPWQGDTLNPITLNKYLYANGNPLTFTDGTGLASESQYTEGTTQALKAWELGNRTKLGQLGEIRLKWMLEKSGQVVVKGPINSPGQHNADIVAFDPETQKISFFDNKIQSGKKTVSWSESIASDTGREKSIAQALGMVDNLEIDASLKMQIKDALRDVSLDHAKANWLIANANDQQSGVQNMAEWVSKRLADRGVLMADIKDDIRVRSREDSVRTRHRNAALRKGMRRVGGALPVVGVAIDIATMKEAYAEDIAHQEFMSELGGESAFPWQSSQRAAAVLAAEEGGGWSGASVGGAAGVYCGPGAWVCVPGGAILGGLVGAIGGGELSGWIHDLSTRLSDSEIEALQLRAQESVARASAAETIKEADSGM